MKKFIFLIVLCIVPFVKIEAIAETHAFTGAQNYLNEFYGKLITPSEYLLKDKVDLIKRAEYIVIGGKDSYLNTKHNYLTETTSSEDKVYYIDDEGNSEKTITTSDSTTAYLKAATYVKPETKVTGTGTRENPYRFILSNDINITSILVDGEASGIPTEGNYTMTYDCKNGKVEWDNENHTVNMTVYVVPVECKLWFSSKD